MACLASHCAMHPLPAHPCIQNTGLWNELRAIKEVVTEPRESGKVFDASMAVFTEAVQAGTGALLIAVCRGKVRQGEVQVGTGALLVAVCREKVGHRFSAKAYPVDVSETLIGLPLLGHAFTRHPNHRFPR